MSRSLRRSGGTGLSLSGLAGLSYSFKGCLLAMDTFGDEGTMSLAQFGPQEDETVPSAEARKREASARINDLAFWVRKRAKGLDADSAFALAHALVDAELRKAGFTQEAVSDSLVRNRFSREEANLLAARIFS